MLVYTPERTPGPDPLARLRPALPAVDVVQVRCKRPGARVGPSPARPLWLATRAVLAAVAELPPERRPLVLVNDRVDVAAALLAEGVAGVHLGDRDCPPRVARAWLGPQALIGYSTHTLDQVQEAEHLPVDYLGFGPVAPTATKGLEAGLGVDLARRAAERSRRPLFAIGGIDVSSAGELGPGARVAVGAAILEAADGARAAAELRRRLLQADGPPEVSDGGAASHPRS
jgi:thiamine-phosphate pyrophosphorylase